MMVKAIALVGIGLVVLGMLLTGLTAQESDGYNEATATTIYAATYAAMPTCELSPMTNVNISPGPCAVPDWYGQDATPEVTPDASGALPDGWADGWLYRLVSG